MILQNNNTTDTNTARKLLEHNNEIMKPYCLNIFLFLKKNIIKMNKKLNSIYPDALPEAELNKIKLFVD